MADDGKSKLERVRWLAEHGSPEQKRRARFYLDVLRPERKREKAAA